MRNAKSGWAVGLFSAVFLFGATASTVAKQDCNVSKNPSNGGGDDDQCAEDGCAGTFMYVFDGDTELKSTYNGCQTDSNDCTTKDNGDSCGNNCAAKTCFEDIGDPTVYWTDIVRGNCGNEELEDGEKIHLGYTIDPNRDVKCEGFFDCEVDCNEDWSCNTDAGVLLEPIAFVNTRILYDGAMAHLTLINNTLPARTLEVSNYRFELVLQPYQLAELNEFLEPGFAAIAGQATLAFDEQVLLDIALPAGFENANVVFALDVLDPSTTSSSVLWTQFYPDLPPVPAVSEWSLMVLTLLGLTVGTVVFARRRPVVAA